MQMGGSLQFQGFGLSQNDYLQLELAAYLSNQTCEPFILMTKSPSGFSAIADCA
jgi:hypothetical protein